MTSPITCASTRIYSRDPSRRRTSDFINDVLTRITLVGALYLIIISIIPTILISGIHFNICGWSGATLIFCARVYQRFGFNFYFGGTSLLIVVGVAMDTVQQVESQLIMRHYDGFSPRAAAFVDDAAGRTAH